MSKDMQTLVAADPKGLSTVEQQARAQYMKNMKNQQENPARGRRTPVSITITGEKTETPKFVLPGDELVRSLKAIIVDSVIDRTLFPPDDGSGNNSPLCSSLGGLTGNPTDEAKEMDAYFRQDAPVCGKTGDGPCPMNVWGSAWKGGRGIACNDKRSLLLFLEGMPIPMRLRTSSTSSSNWDDYLSKMNTADLDIGAYYTMCTLTGKSNGANHWAIYHFERGDAIPVDEYVRIGKIMGEFETALGAMKQDEETPEEQPPPPGDEVAQADDGEGPPAHDDPDSDLPF